MKRAPLLSTAPVALGLLFALGVFEGCSDDCNSAIDCQAGEVCLSGVCTPSQAQFRSCGSDSECNQGAQTEIFECVAGVCLVQGVAPPPPPPPVTDGGVDAGTSTTTDAGF